MLYELRFSINDICDHTFDFSCIDEDLIQELKTIKPQLNYSSKNSQLENKFHMINDTLIPNGFFLKVYVIMKKKITILNLADQQNCTRKTELTWCVLKQFNGMHFARTLNQHSCRKNSLPLLFLLTA